MLRIPGRSTRATRPTLKSFIRAAGFEAISPSSTAKLSSSLSVRTMVLAAPGVSARSSRIRRMCLRSISRTGFGP